MYASLFIFPSITRLHKLLPCVSNYQSVASSCSVAFESFMDDESFPDGRYDQAKTAVPSVIAVATEPHIHLSLLFLLSLSRRAKSGKQIGRGKA